MDAGETALEIAVKSTLVIRFMSVVNLQLRMKMTPRVGYRPSRRISFDMLYNKAIRTERVIRSVVAQLCMLKCTGRAVQRASKGSVIEYPIPVSRNHHYTDNLPPSPPVRSRSDSL